jgi:4-hydroxy-tetrahydrodipicolinate reductase
MNNNIKAAMIGYGQMGHMIKTMAPELGVDIISTIDPINPEADYTEINEESLSSVDVCIDFTLPKTAVSNIEKIAPLGKNIVMATTGWYEQLENVEKIVKENNIGFIWSGNFSTGVNLFFRILRAASKLMTKAEEYDIFAYEMHHNKKADSPSGTAKMLGKILLEEIAHKQTIVYDKLDRRINPEELHFASIRGGSVPGTHTISFDSRADTIKLEHVARSREGFARGAIQAAKWINGKKGFYNIDDFMEEFLRG